MITQNDPEFQKLRRLLTLKRHERAPQGYFENFLDEFHRRQRVEPIRRLGWWEQLIEIFRCEPLLAARYALATAAIVLLCVNVYIVANRSSGPGDVPAMASAKEPFAPVPPPSNFAVNEPRPMLVASNVGPHYVLDRVNITPANYEPRGDF